MPLGKVVSRAREAESLQRLGGTAVAGLGANRGEGDEFTSGVVAATAGEEAGRAAQWESASARRHREGGEKGKGIEPGLQGWLDSVEPSSVLAIHGRKRCRERKDGGRKFRLSPENRNWRGQT